MIRVAVTGCGVRSPIGDSIPEFRRGLFEGRSGIRELGGGALPASFPVTIAGVGEPPYIAGQVARDWRKCGALWLRMDIDAVKQAIEGLSGEVPFDSIVYGGIPAFHFESILGFLSTPELLHEEGFGDASRSDAYADAVAALLAARGLGEVPERNRVCVNTACTSGTHAIGLAFENIRSGEWKRCLVLASDWRPLESGLMNFFLLKTLSQSKEPASKVSRPFSRDRSGVVRGQGAAAIVLEAGDEAAIRKSFGEIAGFATTSDGYRLVDGREDVYCLRQAMERALKSAGICHERIDYVNAHGTSTRLNDRLETKAIKELLGDRAEQVPVSSLKSQIGHAICAAGIIETVACLLMLRYQRIAPTLNFVPGDPDCDLDYVPDFSREAKLETILKNSIAFGGQNASLVIARGG
ncbi:MAG: beta-ketoacyl-[acyl-carrier-protein] synthase family protein [Oligoflexia bacterium]|nr:beta-ketoacyl-[acyl-carrier-protein] synthase family protein [Oligoflexia bacterium]